ncbi:MAG TPA: M23 family metallopeptidase [Thermoanaerobaculia bacterium]|jgi:murein DD-endopeptidase MepM/ murein hydrolase activator NlpD
MPRREHTIIFLPHAKARFRQFRVSSRLLWSLGICFGLSVLLGVTFSALWVRSVRKNSEVTAILAENSDLRSRAALTNTRLETIEKMLAEFEDRTRRLSIVAGLSAVRDPGLGGVGGLSAVPVNPADSIDSGMSEAGRRGVLLSSRLKLVEKKLSLQADQLALTPTIVPTAGVLTAGFGSRTDPFTNHPEFHTGIDISTPAGNRVVAPASGTIVRVGWDKGYGRFVEIAHGYGVTTLFGHLQTARVAEGQRVSRGDLVALVGSSGRSTGPHLHYEVHTDGKPVNPLDYVLNAF